MTRTPAKETLPGAAPALTLVSHHLCPYVQRSVIVLTEKGIPYERRDIDLADKPGWFKAISPLGRVPLLQAAGETLFESAVICEYLDEVTPGSLHPADPLEKARHRAWIEFGSTILAAIAGFYSAGDAEAFEAKRGLLTEKFDWLESHLGKGPYFAGGTFHMVDAVYGPVLRYFDSFNAIGEFGFFVGQPKVRDYRAALGARPSVVGAVGGDYGARLLSFLARRDSYLSSLLRDAA